MKTLTLLLSILLTGCASLPRGYSVERVGPAEWRVVKPSGWPCVAHQGSRAEAVGYAREYQAERDFEAACRMAGAVDFSPENPN